MLITPHKETQGKPDVFAQKCENSLFHRGKDAKKNTWLKRIKKKDKWWLREVMKHAWY